MGHRLRSQSANLLTGVRVLLTPVFVVAVWCADGIPMLRPVGAVVFIVIAASDVWDGRLARRYGSASGGGRVFDHLADIGFLLAAFVAYAGRLLVPWWVPAAIGASFAFYVVDSWSHRSAGVPTLVGSRVGHLAGICNYTLVGVLAFNNTAGIHLLSAEFVHNLFWLVPIYSAAAVISRLAARRAPLSVPEAA